MTGLLAPARRLLLPIALAVGSIVLPAPMKAMAQLPDGVTVEDVSRLALTGDLKGSPSRIERSSVAPGTVIDSREPGQQVLAVRIANGTPRTLQLGLGVVDLESSDGPTSFITAVENARFGASGWLDLASDRLTLQPAQRGIVQLQVRVPQDASPGSAYAGVRITELEEQADLDGTGAATRQTLLLQYLFTVPGDLDYSGRISGVEQPRWVQRSRSGRPRIEFSFENLGNATNSVAGRVRFRSLFGIPVNDAAVEERLVLREASTRFRVTWAEMPWIGRFTPVVELEGRGGTAYEQELDPIWVFPPLLYVILVLAALVVPTTITIRRRRQWNRLVDELMAADAAREAAAQDEAFEFDLDDDAEFDL